MFANKKQDEICIPVSLDEPLTSDSCTKLIMELLKYILYQKQQIPSSYDTLAQLQTRFKPTDKNAGTTKRLFNSLRTISENITSELHASNCEVREVVIVIGATALTPKLFVRLELPDEILNSRCHTEYYHNSRKPLLNLMRSMIDCQEFQEAVTTPLGVTNTFVLLRKHDGDSTSDFFLPKPRYDPPSRTNASFVIKFSQNSSTVANCGCKNSIKVYHDSFQEEAIQKFDDENTSDHCKNDNDPKHDFPCLWYQSREIIKGFKFVR